MITTFAHNLYKHYKGGIYEVITQCAKDEATMETVVIYRGRDGNVWTRTYENFHGIVSQGKYGSSEFNHEIKRFTKMHPELDFVELKDRERI